MRKAPPSAVDIDLEVPFHDVDSLNVVWHGHYYKYAEIGRTVFMRSKGIDFGRPAVHNVSTYIVETRCRHAFPLRYADKFRVRTWVEDTERRINLGFEMINLTHNRRSAWGHTVLITVDADGVLLLETPDAIRRLLG